jgi:transcriptional regulator with XRE-family HTH domain
MQTIGERLKWARERTRLSQRGLAKLAGLSSRHVALIEIGARDNLEIKTLKAIAGALGATLGWLADGEEPQPDVESLQAIGDAVRALEEEEDEAPDSESKPAGTKAAS